MKCPSCGELFFDSDDEYAAETCGRGECEGNTERLANEPVDLLIANGPAFEAINAGKLGYVPKFDGEEIPEAHDGTDDPEPEMPRDLPPEAIQAREEGYRAPTTDAMPWAAGLIAHISTLDDDGRLVTVYDRVPAAGERGWYVASDDPLDEILADLLHNGPSMDGYYGWPAFGDETLTDRDVVSGSFRVVTVEEGSP